MARPVAERRLDRVFTRMRSAAAGRWLAARAAEHLAAGLPNVAAPVYDHVGRQIAMWGRYEREELELLMQALEPRLAACVGERGLVLDVGANIGNHALFFAEHFAAVWAFEPHPRTYQLLSYNAALRPGIRCFNFGLSDREGAATLAVPALNVGMASLREGAAGEPVPCQLLRLDDWQPVRAERVALIKIDVEGHEAAVLRGARGLLARDRPIVLLEVCADEIRDGGTAALDLLAELGYGPWWTLEAYPAGRSRWLNLLRRALFGEGLRLQACERLAPRFHSIVVALPSGWPASI